ncbi:MAG: sugar phosphate nucleotidyltransferase [Acidimicrobiales bacterium]
MRAVVLVGGEGTRLRPLTLTVPKQMLPVVEVPMIERVLAKLARHGVTEAVLSLGYRPDAFLALFPEQRLGDMTVRCVVETEPLGTGGAIRFAAAAAGIDETFVALNGDNLTDLDVTALIDFHRRRSAEGTVDLHRVDDASAFGLVSTDRNGRVLAFVEKPQPGQPGYVGGGDINAGTYVFEPSVLDRIPAGGAVSIEREVFPQMAADGSLYALLSNSYWTGTDTPALYLRAQLDFLDGRRPPPPAPGARLRGGSDDNRGVWLLGDSVINGHVEGPALVGAAAFVHAGAHVERSVIGAGARLAEGAEVRNSVLMEGASVQAGAVVEGSIVGPEAVIGEGARLSGLTVVGSGVEIEPKAELDGARVPAAG